MIARVIIGVYMRDSLITPSPVARISSTATLYFPEPSVLDSMQLGIPHLKALLLLRTAAVRHWLHLALRDLLDVHPPALESY